MTRRDPVRGATSTPDPLGDVGLTELGLRVGDPARFRRRDDEHWIYATVTRRERDGSVGLHDRDGAARAIVVGLIEVRGRGPRGGDTWEPLRDRINTDQQLRLL